MAMLFWNKTGVLNNYNNKKIINQQRTLKNRAAIQQRTDCDINAHLAFLVSHTSHSVGNLSFQVEHAAHMYLLTASRRY